MLLYIHFTLRRLRCNFSYLYATYKDDPVAFETNNQIYYYLKDRQYSIKAIVNQKQKIVETYSYNSYGKTIIKDSSGNIVEQSAYQSYGYTGRRYDNETKLYHYRNRAYDPSLGRFIQTDPKGYVDGYNLYAYVTNNPLRYLDPMGTTALANALSQSRSYTSTQSGWSNYKNPMLVAFGEREESTFLKDIATPFVEAYDVVSIHVARGYEHTATFFQQGTYTLSSLENLENTYDVWDKDIKAFATQSAFIGPAPGADVPTFYPNKRGSGSNAIRHLTLTTTGTAMFGEEYMRGLMNSHEIGSTSINYGQSLYPSELAGDKAVDLRNNEIGYRLGNGIISNNGDFRLNALHAVIDEFHTNGLWLMKQKGEQYEIFQTRMPDNVYESFKEALEYRNSDLSWTDKIKAREALIKNKDNIIR